MKKLLSILGLFALVGVVVFGVSATAQRYHLYRTRLNYQNYGGNRPISRRLDPDERSEATRVSRNVLQDGSFRYRETKAQDPEPIKRIWRGRKHFRMDLYRNNGRFVYDRGGATEIPQENIIETSEYVFGNEAGFAISGGGIYRTSATSLAFRIYEVPDSHCTQASFTRCIQGSMDRFRRSMGVTKIHLDDFAFRQTLHNDFTYHLTYRETFIGRDKNVYFVMGLINPNTGTLVRVEGVALPQDFDRASYYMHKVFESFKFKKQLGARN